MYKEVAPKLADYIGILHISHFHTMVENILAS